MKRTVSAIVAATAGLALLAGCSTTPTTGGGGAAASGSTVKTGLNFELSGAVASYGQAQAQGAEMAAEEINAAGGINGKKIELVKYDDKSDPAEATTLATKLMTQDKVVTVVGPATSGGMKAQIPVATKNKVPVVSGSATADDVTVSAAGLQEYAFRTCFNDSFQGTAMANYATKKLSAKAAIILKDTSNDYSKGLADNFVKTFTAAGGTIVDTQSYVKDQQDFNAILTAIKGKTFDVIYLPGYYNEAGLIMAQARKLGIAQPILGGDGYDSPKLAELAGAGLTDVYFTNHYSSSDKDPKVVAFIDAFKKKYNAEPNAFHALGYDTMKFVADAVKRAGGTVTGESVQKAMAATKDFPGVTGTFSVDPATHNPVKAIVVIGYKDGKEASAEKVA